MATSKSNLEIVITGDTANWNVTSDKLQDGLKKTTEAQKESNKVTKEGSEIAGQAKEGLLGMVESATGLNIAQLTLAGSMVAVVEEMKKTIEVTVELGEKTENLQNITGATAEEASTMSGVFGIMGISTETLTRALEAAVRKGYQPSMEGLQKMRAEYNAIQDPIGRTKYLMDTFGRSGAQLAEYFKADDTTLAHFNYTIQQSGLVMKEDGVEAAQQYSRQVKILEDQWQGLEVTVGQKVIPVLSGLLQSTNNQAEAQKMLEGVVISTGERMRQVAIITAALTEAQNSNVQEEGFLKNAMTQTSQATGVSDQALEHYGAYMRDQYMGQAYDAAAATDALKVAHQNDLEQIKLVTTSFGDLTQQMVFNEAAQGLTAEQTRDLALKMGLLNQETYDAMLKVDAMNAQFQSGKIDAMGYYNAVNGIKSAMDSLNNKEITLTVNIRENGGTASESISGGRTITNTRLGGSTTSGSSGGGTGRAIGGWTGPGSYLTGEGGPEVIQQQGFGQVINNYESTYNLTAHYPKYQDEHAARNDLIAMTMLKNVGAAKWAS